MRLRFEAASACALVLITGAARAQEVAFLPDTPAARFAALLGDSAGHIVRSVKGTQQAFQDLPGSVRPDNPPLASHAIGPLGMAGFGNNESVSFTVRQRFAPIAEALIAAGRYKVLACTYAAGAFAKIYHFWADAVPPNYGEVMLMMAAGSAYGDAAYLGTSAVDACPGDEQGAKTLQGFLWMQRERPDPGAVPPIERRVAAKPDVIGGLSSGSWSWTPPTSIVNAPKVDRFKREIGKIAASGQQVLTCTYAPVSGEVVVRQYWYGSAPSNVVSLIALTYGGNGIIQSMGIQGLSACPPTYADVATTRQMLWSEAQKFFVFN